jgi:hypothetical protein
VARTSPQIFYLGRGAAWGGHLPCKEKRSRVQISGDPPKFIWVWGSGITRLPWEQKIAGSNPATQTKVFG